MSKLSTYIETKEAYESLKKKLETLEQDEALKRTLEVQEKLQVLMDTYKVKQEDVLSMWGVQTKGGMDKRRGTRPLKTYKNPDSGEVVKTRGGNHKVLNEWRKEYGKDTVDAWLA